MRLPRVAQLWALAFCALAGSAAAAEASTSTSGVAASSTADAAAAPSTTFNGEAVPPMTELEGDTVDETIKDGYWLVEFFSPYCGHCKHFAPTWQTLYEFYYTSKPLQAAQQSSNENLNSFTRYYDFKFARLNCHAYGDACDAKKITGYPTIALFKDGKVLKKDGGAKELAVLSKDWVEETLESIRPGSRPAGGPTLPRVGAASVKPSDQPAETQQKDKNPAAGIAAGEKHNSITAAGPSKVVVTGSEATKAATKPKSTPNPSGTSVALTADAFQKRVTNTLEPWFVKFYAPWCHHCQAMAPNWKSMAREMKGVLNIGEVNCEVEKRLCKDAHVKGFPTMLFFRGGERVEYNGLRGVGDLIAYAKKAVDVGTGVTDVDADSFKELEETEEVIFVYFYDHATTSEDFAALDRLTLSLVGQAKLVKTQDPKLFDRFKISTWPRLMVSRDGKPSYYPFIAPRDMRDFRKVLGWMKTVWLPIVPELTASNAQEIMDGAYVVLGILSRDRSDEFIGAKREIKEAALEWIDKETHLRQLERQELRDAKQLRIEEAEDRNNQRGLNAAKQIRIDVDSLGHPKVRFAWVDGVFWERWIKTTYGIDVKEVGERVVINDEDNKRYWDITSTGNPIVPSRTSILETIPKVISSPPKIVAKSTTSSFGRVFHNVRTSFTHHPILSCLLLVASIAGTLLVAKRFRRRLIGSPRYGSGGFFNLGEEKGAFGGFGGSVGEKAD